jgi:hypothetical protein
MFMMAIGIGWVWNPAHGTGLAAGRPQRLDTYATGISVMMVRAVVGVTKPADICIALALSNHLELSYLYLSVMELDFSTLITCSL